VYGWQEHDGRDEPEPIAVMLCTTCSKRLISLHPRVYSSIPRNAPFPGIMDLCIDCRFRAGVTCTHPDRVSNGDEGLQIDAAPGMWAHARTAVGGRTLTLYAYPPRACAQRSVEGADDEIADEHTGLVVRQGCNEQFVRVYWERWLPAGQRSRPRCLLAPVRSLASTCRLEAGAPSRRQLCRVRLTGY